MMVLWLEASLPDLILVLSFIGFSFPSSRRSSARAAEKLGFATFNS